LGGSQIYYTHLTQVLVDWEAEMARRRTRRSELRRELAECRAARDGIDTESLLNLMLGVIQMAKLADMRCSPYRSGERALSEDEITELCPQVPEWTVVEREGIQRLERAFAFPNFAGALAFTNQVGALAEAENHHPAILTEWGKVTVTWWTHKVGGLHLNDFIAAAKTDRIYASG
jgi:4a-hydroxytetrahydrobiopterin dehydratase